MIRCAVAALATVAATLSLASAASAGLDPGLCHATTARGAIPKQFAIDACFDGKTLQLRDQLDVPVNFQITGDYGRMTRTETDVGLAAAVTRVEKPDSRRILPGDTVHVAIGPGSVTVRIVGSPAAGFYFFARAIAKYVPIPAVQAYDPLADLIRELSDDFTKLRSCVATHGLIGQIACRVTFFRDMGFAFARPAVSILLSGKFKLAYEVVTNAKTFSDWQLKGFDGALAIGQTEPFQIAAAGGAPKPAIGAGQDPRLLVVDTSGSMQDPVRGVVKIESAKQSLLAYLKTVPSGTPLGMRVYPSGDCGSGDLRFRLAARDPAEMAAEIRTLQPGGGTPTKDALRAAVEDLKSAGFSRGEIVLVSDGLANCPEGPGGDPCPEAKRIVQSGFALQAITVGFNLDPRSQGGRELQCIANATGGSFLHPGNGLELEKDLNKAARPQLAVDLEHLPSEAAAEVGTDRSGLVRIRATISNHGADPAQDVVARFRFDGIAPGIDRPVRTLGNIEAGKSRGVEWAFRPSLELVGQTVSFDVVATADNALKDASAHGSIRITDPSSARDAGPILRLPGAPAILGDSFSAGEGSGDYLAGTDSDANRCHRSAKTYLVDDSDLDVPVDHVLACSGAVTLDVSAPNAGNHVEAQTDQLRALMRRSAVSGVVLTLGGNDAGFRTVATSCLYPGNTCADQIYPTLTPIGAVSTPDFVEQRTRSLQAHLVEAYAAINAVLNSDSAVARRGSAAPILVLGYPMPLPSSKRNCPSLVTVAPDEIAFVQRFQTKLNGIVDKAALEARFGYLKVPVFYVSNTEDAFAPDHSVCDRDPYARGLESFRARGVDWSAVVRQGIADVAYPFGLRFPRFAVDEAWSATTGAIQELLHPNQSGYRAMTQAIIRWSRTTEAEAALAFVRRAGPAVTSLPTWDVSSQQLDQPGIVLQGGSSYRLVATGFAPSAPVDITLHSDARLVQLAQADAAGAVRTRVAIPRGLRQSRHALVVSGPDSRGGPRSITIPIRVAGASSLPPHVQRIRDAALIAYGAAVALWLLIGAWCLVTRRRDGGLLALALSVLCIGGVGSAVGIGLGVRNVRRRGAADPVAVAAIALGLGTLVAAVMVLVEIARRH